MRFTKGQAKIVVRLCKYVCAACVLGIVCLLVTHSGQETVPPVVGFSEITPTITPVAYKQFAQLRARLTAPFSFQELPAAKRSFLVKEEVAEPPSPPPEPELDTEDLTLMGIFSQKGRRYAVLHDLRDSKVIKVRVGDVVREAQVVVISNNNIVLRLSGKDYDLSWSRPWQQISNE